MEYLYEAPLAMEREKLADVVLSSLRLENRKPDLSDWEEMVESLRNPNKTVKIAIVGKYTQLHDAYLSVVEACLLYTSAADHHCDCLRFSSHRKFLIEHFL